MFKRVSSILCIILLSILWLSPPLFSQQNILQIDTPNIQRIEPLSVGAEEAVLSWFNSAPSTNILVYGTNQQLLDQAVSLSTSTLQAYCLKGLKPNQKYYYRIKNNRQEMSSIRSFQTLPLPSGKYLFSFAVLTDIHYHGQGQGQGISLNGELFAQMDKILENVANQIKEYKPAFTIIKGDMAHRGTRAELDAVYTRLSQIGGKIFGVVGNHDKLNLKWLVNFTEVFGLPKNYYSFSYKGWHFIVLDSNKSFSDGYLSPTQLLWLEDDLKRYQHEKTLIFLHHMVDKPEGIDDLSAALSSEAVLIANSRFISNMGEFKAILEKYPQIVSVNSGHAHLNLVTQDKGITYVTTSALIHYPVTYNICYVYENGYIQMSYPAFQYLREAEESRNKMLDAASLRFGSAIGEMTINIIYGALSDRSFMIDLTTKKGND